MRNGGGTSTKLKNAVALSGFTVAAFAIHGYHYGIEDEAIYLPAIKKILDPSLYPHDSEFFMGQARGTALPWMVAAITRITHAPLSWIVLLVQFVSIYAFLFACWMIAARCFPLARQRWAGVGLVMALLTLPVAGTSIYLADQHLHPRTLACALVLMAVALSLERRALASAVACTCAVLIHPLMAVYGIVFVIVLWLPLERWQKWRLEMWQRGSAPSILLHSNAAVGAIIAIVAIPFLAHPTAAWRAALATREYYSLRNWQWYEWLGLIAPMLIVWWLARNCEKRKLITVSTLLRRLNIYALLMCAITLAVTLPRATEFLWPLQPARYLHTVYTLMILIAGGLLATKRVWPVAAAAVVLGAVMCAVQFVQYPPSEAHHIDLPRLAPANAYVQAFLWARDHTPKDAYFALDPEYMRQSANYGFRALAERSQMADISKDAGVVTVSPQLAAEWKREVEALRGWNTFSADEFARLRKDFGVNWIVIRSDYHPPTNMDCPFFALTVSGGAAVCHTPEVLPPGSFRASAVEMGLPAPLPPSGASN